MTYPAQPPDHKRQSRITELQIYLGRNTLKVAILLVLVTGGIFAFIIQANQWREVQKPANPKRINNDRQRSRYSQDDCANNPHCRQLKRIYDEGGASKEAIRKNILAAHKNVTFEQVQENAAQYEGLPWAFEGKITDIIYHQKNGTGDYILAEVIIGEDPGKLISVKGDFATDFVENDYVYVVGYLTGTSHPRLGPSNPKYRGNVPSLSARALLKPSEAEEFLNGSGAN